MKTKVVVSAFAAALLGLSTAAFAQSTGTRGPTGGTMGQDNPGADEHPATGRNGATGPLTTNPGTRRDADRDRNGASRGASGSYVPERPSVSKDRQTPEHPNVKSADPNR